MRKIGLLLLAFFLFSNQVSAVGELYNVQDNIGKIKPASSYSAPDLYEPKGYIGSVISQIFDVAGRIQNQYISGFQSIQGNYENNIPRWDELKFVQGTITDTGTNIGIGESSPGEKLVVSGRISISGNPNTDDDVGNRGYNDARYIEIGTSGDQIQDGTIDSSEIQNGTIGEIDMAQNQLDDSEIQDNSLTASSLAANSVGNSELNNAAVFSMGGISLNGKAKLNQGGSYDLWIQGGSTDTGGNARNLAILGSKSNDLLRINYNSEYTGGTRFDGNVGIGTSSPSQKLDVNGKIRMRSQTSAGDSNDTVVTKGYADSIDSTNVTRITGQISSRNISTALNLTSDVTFYAADQDTANFLCREQLGLQFGFWRTKDTPTNSGWRPYSNLEISSYNTESEYGFKRLCTSGSDCYNKKTQFGGDLYCYSFNNLPAPSGY